MEILFMVLAGNIHISSVMQCNFTTLEHLHFSTYFSRHFFHFCLSYAHHILYVFNSQADAKQKCDDGETAKCNPCECITSAVPEHRMDQRPLPRILLSSEKDTTCLKVCYIFHYATNQTHNLKSQ